MTVFQSIVARVGSPRERLKLRLGQLFYPQQTAQWTHYVYNHAVLNSSVETFPKLLTKIYRPYSFRRYNCAERVSALIQHYTLVHELHLDALIGQAAAHGVVVAESTTKAGLPIKLRLIAVKDGHREGEIGLELSIDAVHIYSITFLLARRYGEPALIVSRLQGRSDSAARDLVRQATKELHGTRPAALMLFLARHFAALLGCTQVVLVSNQNRVALNPLRRLKITADYNRIWIENGGTLMGDGNYTVSPVADILSDYSDTPSRKRSEAKKKALLLTQLKEACTLSFQQFQH